MPRLRRVPQTPAAAASARRRRQCVIYVIIGAILLRTMGTEYSFLQDMNASMLSNNQVEEQHVAQTGYESEVEHSYQSDTPSEDHENEADQSNDLVGYSIPSREPVNRCLDLSRNPDLFDSCVQQSPRYTCQSTYNTTDMDLASTFDTNCTTYDRTNPFYSNALREILPKVMSDLNIKSIIRYADVGDVDYFSDWKMVPFWVQYFASGASDDMAKKQECFGNEHTHFHRLDLTCTIPPLADLIWVTDLSLIPAPMRSAILYHIQESGIKFLMTTGLNETWFDYSEQTISIAAPLYTSSEHRLGVWQSPFVEEQHEIAWEEKREADEEAAPDNGHKIEFEEENDSEEENDNEAKSDDE